MILGLLSCYYDSYIFILKFCGVFILLLLVSHLSVVTFIVFLVMDLFLFALSLVLQNN